MKILEHLKYHIVDIRALIKVCGKEVEALEQNRPFPKFLQMLFDFLHKQFK